MARQRRLTKTVDYDQGIVEIQVISTGQNLVCNTKLLPEDIKVKMIPFGIAHRIGDAAAGRDGAEAFESMEKVWKGLMEGNFTIRQPRTPGITKADIKDKLSTLKGKEATAAAALLEKLGITL